MVTPEKGKRMGGIVVGSEGSEVSGYAVQWAAREAELRKESLRIVHVLQSWLLDAPPEGPAGQVGQWAREDAGNLLTEAVAQANQAAPAAEVSADLVAGDARPALIDAAEGASMLVVGGRGEGGFAGLLLGSVAYGVVGRTRCPVVVVQRPLGEPAGEVVVGVDASPGSAAALEFAFSEAAIRQATLRAVYTMAPLDRGGAIYGVRLDDDEPSARRELSAAVAPVAERHPTVKVVEAVTEGHPVGSLVNASTGSDLLVVGQRGRGGFARLLLGSVSRGVLHHATCPVTVVPAETTADGVQTPSPS